MSDIRRPAGVTDRIWKVTDKGTVPSITIHYSNDRGGARSADQDGVELALLGYGPVSRATTGSHANLGRTALNVAAAIGMARVIGLGIFKSSRNPGELLVTYQKQRLTDDQQASILAHSPLANRIAREKLALPTRSRCFRSRRRRSDPTGPDRFAYPRRLRTATTGYGRPTTSSSSSGTP